MSEPQIPVFFGATTTLGPHVSADGSHMVELHDIITYSKASGSWGKFLFSQTSVDSFCITHALFSVGISTLSLSTTEPIVADLLAFCISVLGIRVYVEE